ncbi:hypothetical protein KKB83_04305 [Patescibacteria group bacterium]|nr:hypothetical protein [Patescibacteria group bacterium]
MIELTFSPQDNLALILDRLQREETNELKLILEPGNEALQSPANRKLISRMAEQWGKKVFIESTSAKDTTREDTEEPSADKKAGAGTSTGTGHTPLEKTKRIRKKRKFQLSPPKAFLLLAGFFITFLLAAAIFVYFYLPRATVTLYVPESELSRQENLIVNPQIQILDIAQRAVPGQTLTAENEVSQQADATGIKVTGEKASGTVTIVNKTTATISLNKGTVLTGLEQNANLQFVLQEIAEVPPEALSTLDFGVQHLWGTLEGISILAADIGESHNLSLGTVFSVENYDTDKELYAISESALSGGSTTEITIVSAADREQAQSELAAQLNATNKDNIEGQLTAGQELLSETIKNQIVSTSFSHEIGSEAEKFTATVKVQSTATIFDHAQIKELLSTVLQESIPEGFELSSEETTVATEAVSVSEDGQIALMGTIKATVIPQIDSEELRNSLKGVKPSEAENTLKRLTKISGYQIDLWPRLPSFLRTLPHRSARIEFKIEINR